MPNPILRGGLASNPLGTPIVRPDDRTLTPTGTVQIPSIGGKIILGGTVQAPTTTAPTPSTFGLSDQFIPPKTQSASAGNLAARLDIPQLQNPPLQPPVGMPQRNQSQILLPESYRQNPNGAPSIYPPLTIRNGITMPSASPGVKPQTFPGMNWADFLTVIHNMQPR